MDDLKRWRDAVVEVREQLLLFPGRSENEWLREFPRASCSVTSYAVGRLLLERFGEQWLLTSRRGESQSQGRSHTWLVRDPAEGPDASIDATADQFEDIATDPFIGFGDSPSAESFPPNGLDSYVALAAGGWHHGRTDEIYEWLFPRLGLTPFERDEDLRHLLPDDVASPPVARLVDAMLDASEAQSPTKTYGIMLAYRPRVELRRNSDAAMRRNNREFGQYRGRFVLEAEDVGDDTVLLVAGDDEAKDRLVIVGCISSQRFQSINAEQLATFDISTIAAPALG